MLVHRGVAAAFGATGAAGFATGEKDRLQHGVVGSGAARGDGRRCRAEVGAVEVEADALTQLGDVRLAEAGVGAGGASLRAVEAFLDRAEQVRVDGTVQGGMGADHRFGVHVDLQSGDWCPTTAPRPDCSRRRRMRPRSAPVMPWRPAGRSLHAALVPAVLLGDIHRVVGSLDEVHREVLGREHRHADADGGALVELLDPVVLGREADSLGDREGLMPVGLDEDDGELLAAIAAGGIGRPQPVLQDGCHRPQHFVADDMSVAVVDLLEVIDVDEQKRERALIALGPLYLQIEPLVEGPPVQEASQRVRVHQPLELPGPLGHQLLQRCGRLLHRRDVGVGADEADKPVLVEARHDLFEHPLEMPALGVNPVLDRAGIVLAQPLVEKGAVALPVVGGQEQAPVRGLHVGFGEAHELGPLAVDELAGA